MPHYKKMELCCNLHEMNTEQDMPLQEDWRFSRFLMCRISMTQLLILDQCLNWFYDTPGFTVEPHMKGP
jgi:hypothetical protein